jgi:hypothetical protein
MTLRSKLATLGALVTVLALASPAQAATSDTSITLNAGTLDYTTPFSAGNFPNTTLNGLPQVVHAGVNPWTVTDGRGSLLNGWNLTISATQFSTGGGSPHTLPTGSMTLATVPVPSTSVGNVSLPPVPVPLAAALDGGSAQKVATSAVGQGLGQWTFTSLNPAGGDLALVVPASAVAGTYTSTITSTLSTGP